MPILKTSNVLTAMDAVLQVPGNSLFYGQPPVFPACGAASGAGHMRSGFILYQRDDCHLCDLALDVLARAGVPALESVFIDGDAALEARYGLRVPVLHGTASGEELDWPFDPDILQGWLAAAGPARAPDR